MGGTVEVEQSQLALMFNHVKHSRFVARSYTLWIDNLYRIAEALFNW